MHKTEPALYIGRRRRNVRAVGAVLCLLVAAVVAAAVAKTMRPARVSIMQAVGAGSSAHPAAPIVQLSADSVAQGGALSVKLQSARVVAASAQFNGRNYPMVNDNGTWCAILGAGQRVTSNVVFPPGVYPITVRYQLAGQRGVATENLQLTVTAVSFPTDTLQLRNDQLALVTPAVEASEAAQLSETYGAFTPRQLWQGAFVMPVQGPITTVFGDHVGYDGGPPVDSHPGIDIAVPLGTPVQASAAGVVAWTGSLADRGNGVIIDHGLGVFTGYFHLSEIDAHIGQQVGQGDIIGHSGNTGFSTGPHVHWEVAIGDVNVDGLQFVKQTLP